ncbi:MAG: hypothetical protein RIK85_06110 [Marinobacter sp.]
MSLILRESLYILLGSGGLYVGFLALITLLSLADTSIYRIEMSDWVVMGFLAASLIGLVSGIITVFALPVYKRAYKVLLTVGMISGYPTALIVLFSILASASSFEVTVMWLYFVLCPLIVSIMLIVEMWHTGTHQNSQARTR